MTELSVSNMTCAPCMSAVTRAVKSIDPQAAVQVDLQGAEVRVQGAAQANDLIAALDEAGYPAAVAAGRPAPAAAKSCCGCGH